MNIEIENSILIIGAGDAGQVLLAEYEKRGSVKSVAGFIDDDILKEKNLKSGKKILGTTNEIRSVLIKNSIGQVIIAMPSVESNIINKIISEIISYSSDLNIHILPSVEKYFESVPLLPSLEDISFNDIFDRDEFEVAADSIGKELSGKTVLITGAGGSIGSEICKQILKFNIKSLVAIGRGETSIYNLIKELDGYLLLMNKKPECIYKIADVKDINLLGKIFNEYKPDVVFHAAAHKHVPLMEMNEAEALQNNISGTKNVLDASINNNVKKFVMISTDKAVHPVNIMGATKRVAELITEFYGKNENINASIVRFGNVIGSRGSVIPLFIEQIKKGGPVTVTHPDIKRFFMSIPEASLLVINTAVISHGSEVFVLDMGKQYKISDIAEKLITLYGNKIDDDIKIEYTGLRPGEKLYEELFYKKELLISTNNDKIFISKDDDSVLNLDKFNYLFNEFIPEAIHLSSIQIRKKLKELIPEYNYDENFENNNYNRMVK